MNGISILSEANRLFQGHEYKAALELYQQYSLISAKHAKRISLNLKLAESRLDKNSSHADKNKKHEPLQREKVIVYSVNIGGYESVKEPLYIDPTVEYILFTDDTTLTSKYWNIIYLDMKSLDFRRASRLPKILAHKYLPEHDVSVYIDSSLEIKVINVRKMIDECMEGKDIALYRHYKRNCVYEEINFVMNSEDRIVTNKNLCITALKKYESINYPREKGLFENACIFRRNTNKIKNLNNFWWKEYEEGAERDQFVLMYALHAFAIKPNPISIGSQFRDNPYLNFYRHKYISYKNTSELLKERKILLNIEGSNSVSACSTNWIVGGEDNAGWAYENNAKRFIDKQKRFDHFLQSELESDVAIYFDVLLFDRMPVRSRSKIVRIGGPRPINRLCGDDVVKLKKVLENFHSVICLNQELTKKISSYHPNVHMIPNGIDLVEFSPSKLKKSVQKNYTVGFAGSVKSVDERKVKGLDFVIEACKLAKAEILSVGRGPDQIQIPHNRMIEDFYSRIDVLVHPVDAGREGSSNVIMECLALGIPVITTEFSGYHAEHLEHKLNYLKCKRDSRHIAGKILDLINEPNLRNKLSKEGRLFAEKHHDLAVISKKYEKLILEANFYEKSTKKISFNPFWYPVQNFATGRIRSMYPANLLSQVEGVSTKLGYDSSADIVFVSQLADDVLLKNINENPMQFVIYDVCDKYYEDNRVVGGVNAKSRFYEIVERANLIITSTLELKKEIYDLNINKPIVYVQDGIDFREIKDSINSNQFNSKIHTVGWFGNPNRGNLDSAVWLLDRALDLGKELKLITKMKSVRAYPKLYPYSVEWRYASFISELKKCDLVIVTHAKDEQNKSPNRMLTAVANGIPVIVSSSRSCETILNRAGLDWAIVNNIDEYENAITLLEKPEIKKMYFRMLSTYIDNEFGDNALLRKYKNVINDFSYQVKKSKKKVLFVSHNLSIGEGAPTSLYQTIVGLKNGYSIEPHVYCPMTGDFKEKYEEKGIPIYNYTKIVSKDSLKPLNANFEKTKVNFQEYLAKENFDLVICNTAKMLPYASFAFESGVSAISIVRESSDEHIDLTFSKNTKIIEAAKDGLKQVKEVIFVSDVTRKAWQKRQWLPNTRVIHNGIITEQWDYLKKINKHDLRDKLNLPKDKKILLSVGTINARKAQIDIVNAYQQLPLEVISQSYLVLVGARESGYLTLFKKEIDKLPDNIKSNILLVPETDNVGEWYKASDIFVFSSHNESYPRVIVEALYFGLQVISSRVYGVIEQLEDDDQSFIYDIGDVMFLTKLLRNKVIESRETSLDSRRFFKLTTFQEMISSYYSVLNKV